MLAAAIERRFEGAKVVPEGSLVRAEVPIDGSLYLARVMLAPSTRLQVQVPHTDGFELSLAWTDRRTTAPRPQEFDDSYLVETNDVPLAAQWLDMHSRTALLASRYVTAPAARNTAVMLRDGRWSHELRDGELVARCAGHERSTERITDMLSATLALASRPTRWAKMFGQLARELGGVSSRRVEIGGKPVLKVRRGQVDVTVRVLRRLDPDEQGRFRTVIGAHRRHSGGETLTLIADDLPRAAWPPPPEVPPDAPRMKIKQAHSNLLDEARPSASIVRPHDVEITFDGAVTDRARLGAAIELAAQWAAASENAGPDAPYR
ncbi:MAG: hypothetical protein QM831_37380 [Kofleriaceae bacterium]